MADQNSSSKRRKWDQADSTSEAPTAKVLKSDASVTKSVDPVEAANLAAAKINALYATKNATITPTNTSSNIESSSESNVPPTSNSVPQAPSINKVEFSKKIEINDLKNRYMLTRGPTQAEITEETGAEITTRGKYYPDANLATEKEPPLYLFISATNQESLDQAVNKVNELIETATLPTPGPPSHGASNHRHDHNSNKSDGNDVQYGDRNNNNNTGGYSNRSSYDRPPRKFHEEDVPVDIADGPHYNLRAKIVGPQGANVKHISSVTGCRIQLRGKGSGFYEQETGVESEEPLHIHISTPRQEMLVEAVKLSKDLIQTIKEEVEKRNQQNSYNRGYHYPQGYDYQAYGTESPNTTTAPATESGENYAYGYGQYDYYGQQQYDPNYYNQYNQYNQYYQQPQNHPPPPPPSSHTEAHQQSSGSPGSTSNRHSSSPSPNSPPRNGSSPYNSVPPPSHY